MAIIVALRLKQIRDKTYVKYLLHASSRYFWLSNLVHAVCVRWIFFATCLKHANQLNSSWFYSIANWP